MREFSTFAPDPRRLPWWQRDPNRPRSNWRVLGEAGASFHRDDTRQQQRADLRKLCFEQISEQYGGESRRVRRKVAAAKARNDWKAMRPETRLP